MNIKRNNFSFGLIFTAVTKDEQALFHFLSKKLSRGDLIHYGSITLSKKKETKSIDLSVEPRLEYAHKNLFQKSCAVVGEIIHFTIEASKTGDRNFLQKIHNVCEPDGGLIFDKFCRGKKRMSMHCSLQLAIMTYANLKTLKSKKKSLRGVDGRLVFPEPF